MIKRPFSVALVALAILAPGVPGAWAQKAKMTAKPAVKLPSAVSVMDKSQKATGGKGAFAAMKTLVMRGTMEIVGQQLKGTMETRIALPNKIYVSQDITGVGKFEKGFDGTTGWSRDPLKGLQTLKGAELIQLKAEGDTVKAADWHNAYSKAEMIGTRKVGAGMTYAIRLTPIRGGKPLVNYYDTKTYLPVRSDIVLESAEGSIPTQSFPSDYRKVNGIMFPFKMRSVVGAAEMQIAFSYIRANAPVDDAVFAKPADTAPAKPAPKP